MAELDTLRSDVGADAVVAVDLVDRCREILRGVAKARGAFGDVRDARAEHFAWLELERVARSLAHLARAMRSRQARVHG